MVTGLSHITFIVRDLDRLEAVPSGVPGARKVYDSGDETFSLSPERFFLVGGAAGDLDVPAPIWIAIMEGEPMAQSSYNHVAFKIRDADYDDCLDRIRRLGLEVREGRARVEGEGRSIYFEDHDNRLFELHTGTLSDRLRRYARGPTPTDES